MNIAQDSSGNQKTRLREALFAGADHLNNFDYRWLRGAAMGGHVIGGNIRCFLKLAGTPYMPSPEGKIIFLESLGGGINRIASLLAQLEQMNYFRYCSGVVLGTFSQLEVECTSAEIEKLFLEVTEKSKVPVIKTNQLGHGEDASCIVIGEYRDF